VHHCSPEDLALAALGEELSPGDTAHLASCASCTGEVASLRRAADALGDGHPVGDVPLPPRVWAAIAAETGVASGAVADPAPVLVPAPRSATVVPPLRRERPATTLAPAPRRRRSRWLVGAAVAAGLLVGIGIGTVGTPDGGDDPSNAVAAARLDPLEGWDDEGAATLLDRDGRLELQVELPTTAVDDGFYEVWLLGADSGAVALGVLQDGAGSYPLPTGVDLAEYGTVDVSLEPFDGDPAHSTDSVARGSLR